MPGSVTSVSAVPSDLRFVVKSTRRGFVAEEPPRRDLSTGVVMAITPEWNPPASYRRETTVSIESRPVLRAQIVKTVWMVE
jgi:hypothetical protein